MSWFREQIRDLWPKREDSTFRAVAFQPDGRLIGSTSKQFTDLSEEWVGKLRDLIHNQPPTFRALPHPRLDQLELNWTTTEGRSGLATFSSASQIATSCLYLDRALDGTSRSSEAEVLERFHGSLTASEWHRKLSVISGVEEPFAELFAITERPMVAAVYWSNPEVDDDTYDVISQLQLQLAGALFEQDHR